MTTEIVRAPLVGRAAETEAVQRFLDRGAEGSESLFLEGEPGIGKTRVWTEAVRLARQRSWLVLRTRPAGAGAEFAYAGLGDLLRDRIDTVLPELPAPQRRALGAALLLDDRDVPVDRHAVAAALLGALRMLADQPVTVAIDDAQWLDAASTDALSFAFRRLESEPVGLLCTVRIAPDVDADQLVTALPEHRVTRLPLRPLSVAALYEIVRDRLGVNVSRATLLRLHETSGGNPFYALEIARLLAETGEPRPGEPLPVPKDLHDVVRARLSGVSAQTAQVLLGAAALARPSAGVLQRTFEGADVALAEAVDASLLEIDGDDVRFSHPLLASIHYEDAPQRLREATHRRLAAVLPDGEERARHRALAISEPNETVAAELEAAACDADRRGAPGAAAELAELAVARTDPRSPALHGRALIAADFLFAIGRPDRARALLDDALAVAERGNDRAVLLLKAAVIATQGESAEAAIALAHEGLSSATDDAVRARLLSHLALFGYVDGYDQAVAYGREAIAHAERSGDPAVLAESLAVHAWRSYVNTGVVLFDPLDRAAELEQAQGRVAVASGAFEARAQVLADAGHFDRARAYYEELLAIARARDDVDMTHPLAELATIDYEEGRFDSAAERAKEAAEIAAQGGRLAAEGTALFRLAGVEAARGNVDDAIELCERSARLLDASGLPLRGARLMRGRLELSLENYEAAWNYLDWSQPRNGTEGMGRPRAQVPEAIEALVGLGRLDEAREFLEPFDTRARQLDRAWAMAWAAKCRGLIAAAEGDLEAAETALLESVELELRAGRPFERARSLLALGTVQRRRRRKQAARATLREASETFKRLGARIWATRADAELRRIGGRAAPAGEALSATEERIVELARSGRTNREIAEALSLSPKTVEWNLSKIYRKLGVRSRTELAATR